MLLNQYKITTVAKDRLDPTIKELLCQNEAQIIDVNPFIGEHPDTVSVIVRVFNSAKFIQQALESIYIQKYSGRIQIVIVYDNTTVDNTLDIIFKSINDCVLANNISFRIISQSHLSIFRAFQIGLQHSTGNYIAVLDSDNLFTPYKLMTQLNYLRNNNAHFCFHPEKVIDASGEFRTYWPIPPRDYRNINSLLRSNFVDTSTIFFDRSFYDTVLKAIDVLDDPYFDWAFEDYFIAMIASMTSNLHYIAEPLTAYRIHGENSNAIFEYSQSLLIKDKRKRLIGNGLSFERCCKTLMAIELVNTELHLIDEALLINYLAIFDEKTLSIQSAYMGNVNNTRWLNLFTYMRFILKQTIVRISVLIKS